MTSDTTIEVAMLITIISVCVAVYSTVNNLMRNNKKDIVNDASQMTTIMVKLETISTGIAEIKSEINSVKSEQRALQEKILIVEQSLDTAWKRIDENRAAIESLRTEGET